MYLFDCLAITTIYPHKHINTILRFEIGGLYSMNTGEKIKFYRTEAGLSQKKLGELAGGINEVTIRKYEAGDRNPKIEQLQKIATALNISIYEFIDFDVTTVSDALSLLFKLDNLDAMNINYQDTTDGIINPETISITFSDPYILVNLAQYLKARKIYEESLQADPKEFSSQKEFSEFQKKIASAFERAKQRIVNTDINIR